MATAFTDVCINNLQKQITLARAEIKNLRLVSILFFFELLKKLKF